MALEQAGKFSEAIEEAERGVALVTNGPGMETIKADISRIREKVAAGAERPVDAL